MLPPLSQTITALNAEISGFLSAEDFAPTPQILMLSNAPGLAGIGGFVGINDVPKTEIYARKIKAEIAVRVFGDTSSDLADAEVQATTNLLGADPVQLRRAGIFNLKRLTDRATPLLRAADGIPQAFGRDIVFSVTYEHKPLPETSQGMLDTVPVDTTQARLTRGGGLIYANDFGTDPLADFQARDRVSGTGSAGNWSYDAVAQEITQTGTTSGGNNGIAATKVGTYLTLTPSAGGAVRNFVVTAEMQCGATGGIGFVFRFMDVENHGFVILESPANVRVIAKRIAGVGTLLDTSGQDTSAGFTPDTWHRLRFLADGDRFELAVDEQTVLAGRDAGLPQTGSVGFFCRRASTARFRHFRLSGL